VWIVWRRRRRRCRCRRIWSIAAIVKRNLHRSDKITRDVVPDDSHTHLVSIRVQDDSFVAGRVRLIAWHNKSKVYNGVAHFFSDVSLDHAITHVICVESCVPVVASVDV
jgi:hypothetical protein